MNLSDLQTVFVAEFVRRVKSRAFLIGLIIGMFGIVLFTKMPALVGNAFSGSSTVVLIGEPALTARAAALLRSDYDVSAQFAPGTRVTPELLKQNKAAGAFTIERNKNGLAVTIDARDPSSMGGRTISRDLQPLQLALSTNTSEAHIAQLSNIPLTIRTVGSKFSSSDQAVIVKGIAYVLLFFLYLLILLNSQLITSSVAEEKTSRIAELLVASVEPSALLAGKVLAGTAIALLQMVAWIAAGVLTSPHASAQGTADANSIFSLASIFDVLTPMVVLSFLAFFLIGMLQLATVFAALASLINRTEDLGSITGPLTIPVVAAFFIAISALGSPDSPFVVTSSFIPIVSPFVMFARIAVSNVPIWEVVLALAINLIALYAIALLAGKIYRVGMLLYGRTPKLGQVWNVIRS